ncbi:cytoplasmic protein [Virgibacillus phasianinus]|uniref:Cytoplasmic protein n=1 Tax=Virgibacillus phasianinus TaxID=2017483 RepID=A0A220U2L8_9BACI|nr:DUF1697 domain-containing protein [Virgibacillus phasianinus]ASK62369.1 cytoplasmic protein [Virgibacillus phasianinus]
MNYIALLRGINVGGKNRVKMAELRHALELMGLNRVQTYIHSGNILFESDEEKEPLQIQIENKIEEEFGFSVSVILRTDEELERIIRNCPFPEKALSEAKASAVGESLHVALLPKLPSQEEIERLSSYKSEQETYQVEGRDIYLLFYNSIRNSRLVNRLQKLGVPVTIRNWKTLNKLAAMIKTRKV